ncbi:hypothetical protein [Leifsonia aquatica]|uniref:hypothetical protein n=1 Tax=Leifsonia aquatica TaxID=144185 RepID=UPI00381E36BE
MLKIAYKDFEDGEEPIRLPGNPFSAQGAKLVGGYEGLFNYGLYKTELENVLELLEDQFPDATGVDPVEYVATLRKASYRNLALEEAHWRAVVDYICGMSDSEALLRSQWLTGTEIPGMSALGVPLT